MAEQKAWLYSLAGAVVSPILKLLYRVKFRNKIIFLKRVHIL